MLNIGKSNKMGKFIVFICIWSQIISQMISGLFPKVRSNATKGRDVLSVLSVEMMQ